MFPINKCFNKNNLQLIRNLQQYNGGSPSLAVKKMTEGLKSGNRGSLAQAITLVEATNAKKKKLSKELLQNLLHESHSKFQAQGIAGLSFRIGLSGPPGAGKSTFIETFGKFLTSNGKKVAVLAVDPSSVTTGGSLLGDKTRMPELTKDMNAYIRASPARGYLGGVTRSTNEAIIVCEAAGYDVIIIETVGVGQSEFSVADMVDMFGLIIPPGGGDELQGLKRGIMEMSDLIVINKSDGDLVPAARRMQYEYMSALKYIRSKNPEWRVPVERISSLTGDGIEDLWNLMMKYRELGDEKGFFLKRRRLQRKSWMWSHLNESFMTKFRTMPDMAAKTKALEEDAMTGLITPFEASDSLLEYFMQKLKHEA